MLQSSILQSDKREDKVEGFGAMRTTSGSPPRTSTHSKLGLELDMKVVPTPDPLQISYIIFELGIKEILLGFAMILSGC